MYQLLIIFHSLVRWLVLASLLYALYRAYRGYTSKVSFSRVDNAIRHWTATIAHIQLLIGILLYTQSPVVKYFWKDLPDGDNNYDAKFFGLIHITLMLAAVTCITIGSALAKRRPAGKEKFKTMLIWFAVSLLIILIAIPWPFSPLANRPYLRTF